MAVNGYQSVNRDDRFGAGVENQGMAMTKVAVVTAEAPAAIGPYAQAIKVGEFVYTSGQIPLDPKTMELVEGGIAEQTKQVLENLKAVLAAAGTDLTRVIKALVFLQDLGDFGAMNAVYERLFREAQAGSTTEAVPPPGAVYGAGGGAAERGAGGDRDGGTGGGVEASAGLWMHLIGQGETTDG